MPTKLTEPLVQDALTRLTGWAGDEQMIHREFVLDGDPRERLLDEIEALAGSTDHTIMLTDTSAGLDVSLATTTSTVSPRSTSQWHPGSTTCSCSRWRSRSRAPQIPRRPLAGNEPADDVPGYPLI